jgi:hypothetical protein
MPPVSSALTGDRVKTAVQPQCDKRLIACAPLSLFIVLTVVILRHPESWVGKRRPRTYVIWLCAKPDTVPQRLLSVPF